MAVSRFVVLFSTNSDADPDFFAKICYTLPTYTSQGYLLVPVTRLTIPIPFSLWLHLASVCCPTRQSTPATSGGRRYSRLLPCEGGCARLHRRGSVGSSWG